MPARDVTRPAQTVDRCCQGVLHGPCSGARANVTERHLGTAEVGINSVGPTLICQVGSDEHFAPVHPCKPRRLQKPAPLSVAHNQHCCVNALARLLSAVELTEDVRRLGSPSGEQRLRLPTNSLGGCDHPHIMPELCAARCVVRVWSECVLDLSGVAIGTGRRPACFGSPCAGSPVRVSVATAATSSGPFRPTRLRPVPGRPAQLIARAEPRNAPVASL